jgi:alanine racemase
MLSVEPPALSTSPTPSRCWAEIDLGALRDNVGAIRKQSAAGVEIMAVVKANAYGHGVVPVVGALRDEVEMFGVANLAEARELKEQVSPRRIFILGPALPEERQEVAESGFIPAVSSYEEAAAYSLFAGPTGRMALHLAVDTGMGRIGAWEGEALAVAEAIAGLPRVVLEGVATHLPVADEDDAFTRAELERFDSLVKGLASRGVRPRRVHSHNSAGVIGFSQHAGNLVRVGLALYGSSPLPEFQDRVRAALTWKTRVSLVRDLGPGRGVSYGRTFVTPGRMRVATLAVGYADGYQRHLSGRGAEVLLQGKRCPVLGRVTMDQIMVDVSGLPKVEAGDEVVLIGRQAQEQITAAELAAKAGSIPWEIFTGIGSRVARHYV